MFRYLSDGTGKKYRLYNYYQEHLFGGSSTYMCSENIRGGGGLKKSEIPFDLDQFLSTYTYTHLVRT